MIINNNSHNQIEWTEDFNPFDLTFDENLEEDIEKHEVLNPKLWNDDATLKAEVQEKIQTIVQYFLNQLQEDGIKINIKDIILVGSNCSYNYTKDSDLDIHIIADTSSLKCPDNLYPLLYSAYRSLFNGKYNISFYGIPVEIYVEVEDSPRISNGCYSVLNQKWITEPVKADIPDIDMDEFYTQFEEWENKYNNLLKGTTSRAETIELINQLIEQIYELRKNGLAKEGEYGIDNLIFKEFRNRGYLDELKELKNELIGQEFSLESLKEQYANFWESAEHDTLIEKKNGDWNKSKEMCITAVQQYEQGTKIQKIAGKTYAAVWHHLNGIHDYFNFENYVLIVDWGADDANLPEIAHKCIHCYAILKAAQFNDVADSLLAALHKLDNQIIYYLFNQFDGIQVTKTNKDENKNTSITSVYRCNNFNDYWNRVGNLLVNYYKKVNLGNNEDEIVGTIPALKVANYESPLKVASYEPPKNEAMLQENTIKVKDHKWTNKGKHGTHGFFKTKEAADAQRRAMFVNESNLSDWEIDSERQINHQLDLDKKEQLKNTWSGIGHYYSTYHDDWSGKTINSTDYFDSKEAFDNFINKWSIDSGRKYHLIKIERLASDFSENLEEEFNKEMLLTYAKEIQEATNYFPIMQENGIFEIYNLPENTVNLTLSQINNLDFIEWVQKAVTNFNVSADTLMNIPSRKYKIYGQIKI